VKPTVIEIQLFQSLAQKCDSNAAGIPYGILNIIAFRANPIIIMREVVSKALLILDVIANEVKQSLIAQEIASVVPPSQ
jgi:hypothetical protein